MGTMAITPMLIKHLIKCPKVIVRPFPRTYKIQSFQKRKKLYAQSQDGTLNFEIQFHQHIEFGDHYTALLMGINCIQNVPRIILFRANSMHGGTRGNNSHIEHHQKPHIHIMTAEEANAGNFLNPNPDKDVVPHYVGFDSALLYFFRECNIINYGDMFDLSTQISWFGELET